MNRLLPMMLLLSGNRKYTVDELANRFEMSDRTVFRYLETYEQSGFVLDKKGGYRLHMAAPAYKSLQKLLHFSEDEAYILYQTLDQIEGSSPIKERLLRKLNVLYDFHILKQQSPDALTLIQQLRNAIEKKQQVRLLGYRSSNSGSISDRIVEPFAFLPDYEAIWAIEVSTESCKQFRLSRIGGVQDVGEAWNYEDRHKVPFCDAFRMAASEPLTRVQAKLTLKACNLLLEEYPQTREYIKPEGKKFLLDIPVASYAGVGRFIMGLPGHVEVLGPVGLKTFLKKEVEKIIPH